MIGLIVAGHICFGTRMAEVAKEIVGEGENFRPLDFMIQAPLEQFDASFEAAVAQLDCSDGLLVLCDLFGGTPFNRIMMKAALEPGRNIHVIAGANLAMLMEAMSMAPSATDPKALAQALMEAVPNYIVYANDRL